MTSTRFWDFFTPPPLRPQNLYYLFVRYLGSFSTPTPPSVRTSYMEAPSAENLRGRQRVVSYIIMPRGDGRGERQQEECHQEDSLTLALSPPPGLWRREGKLRGKIDPQWGKRNSTALVGPYFFFQIYVFQFCSAGAGDPEIPCL